jgi:glutathione S-transferase
MKAEPDEARLAKVLAEDLPPVFDWLESQVPESGDAIVGGRFSIADIGIATQLVNGRHAGLDVDASRWPRLAAYCDTVLGNPYFKPIVEEETAQFGAM